MHAIANRKNEIFTRLVKYMSKNNVIESQNRFNTLRLKCWWRDKKINCDVKIPVTVAGLIYETSKSHILFVPMSQFQR